MNEPELEPYVVHLPSRKFVSKSVRLANQKAAEEGKIDSPKSKKTYDDNKKSYYYQKNSKWRQNKSNNWKKTSNDEHDESEKDVINNKPQKRLTLSSKSYSNRWNGQHNNILKQIEEAGIIATPAKKPGVDRGPFQRSFDTFMFGNRSILPDPSVINSGDSRLKYKSFKELSDSTTVSDKIYKYPVNDMTGTYQRSMTNARFGASSSISEASISSRLRTPTMVPVLKNQKIPKCSSTRSLNNNVFGSEESVTNDNNSSPHPLMEGSVTRVKNLRRIRDESFNQMELKQSVAGPISCLPDLVKIKIFNKM
jgi:hypothetical protein